MTAVKVENGGERKQRGYAGKLPQAGRGFSIHPGHGPIEPGQHRVVEQGVQHVASRHALARLGPIFSREQERHLGSREGIRQSLAALQGLFQFRQRKSGIDGQKGALRIGGFEGRAFSARLSKPVSQDVQQRSGLVAIGDSNDSFRSSQGLQLPGLPHITLQQNQELRGSARPVLAPLITFDRDVAR